MAIDPETLDMRYTLHPVAVMMFTPQDSSWVEAGAVPCSETLTAGADANRPEGNVTGTVFTVLATSEVEILVT